MATRNNIAKDFRVNVGQARENGSVLIISLLILIVLTMLGLTAVRNTTLEEKMAGNLRDTNLAFQAAESALRDAETFTESVVSVNAFNDTGGLISEAGAEPDYFAAASWGSSNSQAYSGSFSGVAAQPRYIIKYLGVTSASGGSMNIGGYGNAKAGDTNSFRITARGVGGRDGTQVILQEYYGRRF